MHLLQLGRGDSFEAVAMNRRFAVFDFGKINIIGFCRDDVDFIEECLVVSFNNCVIVAFQIIGDGLFGLSADVGGIFAGFCNSLESRKRFTWFERFAMLVGETIFVNGIDVRFGAITNVFFETVIRILVF